MLSALEDQALTSEEVDAIRRQLEHLVGNESFRTSRRSVAFLRYIVEQTLQGNADELKERTIGINVFGKALTYDTNMDHVVRTAASELRKRLAIYYGQEEHRAEFRIQLVPGSYIPQFHPAVPQAYPVDASRPVIQAPAAAPLAESQPEIHFPQVQLAAEVKAPAPRHLPWRWVLFSCCLLLCATFALTAWIKPRVTPQQAFWMPLLRTEGPVLIAVGDVPNGPPVTVGAPEQGAQPAPNAASPGPPRVPYADAVTVARVAALLSSMGKEFLIRRESASSFADLRERPLVLVGAFNNEWSLRFARGLRFSLAMDQNRRLIYIRDSQNPASREWQWSIDPHPAETDRNSGTPLHDYALISRVLDSETGHEVVIIGGLYTYGTQAAGEFLASPQMADLARRISLDSRSKRVQLVLETQVTDGAAGPPRIVAVNVD